MPFTIIRNDITKVKADAIVNTANMHPVIGGGTDTAVYNAAGKEKLLAARKLIGDIEPGTARETSAYNLDAKFIIHTVCVPWNGGKSDELDVLADCFRNSLQLALELNCKSIAFPLIGTGVFGIPHDDALSVAKAVSNKFLEDTGSDMAITLVVFDQMSFESGAQISKRIKQYIDDNYVENAEIDEYGSFKNDRLARERELYRRRNVQGMNHHSSVLGDAGKVFVDPSDLSESFVDKMFEYADAKGVKDSEFYGGKYEWYFSKSILTKMRKDPDYHPTKYLCLVVCLVLKLNLNETLDMLERAGYTLSKSRKADVVVSACIVNGKRKVELINDELDKYGCDELKLIK